MPLLTKKMSSHFRQGNGYSDNHHQSKSIYREDDEYIPSYQHRYYVNSKKYVDYSDEDLDYPPQHRDDDEDPDALYRRSREKFASWAIRDLSPRRQNGEVKNNNKVYENFGSLKKKNEKNAGLNKGIRAIVEKLKLKSDDKKDPYKSKSNNKEVVDEEWRYDNGTGRKTVEVKIHRKQEPRRRSSPEDEDENYRREKRRSYAFEASPEDFDVRIERYERAAPGDRLHRKTSFKEAEEKPRNKDRKSARRRSSSRERNGSDESFRRERNGSDDSFRRERNGSDESFRRSSPKNGSVDRRERKYEEKRKRSVSRDGRYRENDSPKRSSSRDRERYKDSESPRRSSSSSPRNVTELVTKGKPPKPKISERHSRPLTPPKGEVVHYRESSITESPRKKEFCMKEWYESNRQFAAKYLKENSKIKELATADAKDEFVFELPEEKRTVYEIKNGNNEGSSSPETIVKTVREERRKENGSSRRIYEEEAEEERRSYTTPSRKTWNYREGV